MAGRRAVRAWIAVFLVWAGLATSALAENRIALVIGNDRYDNLSERSSCTTPSTTRAQ
jgi:uncharacterized membrane protein